MDDVQRRHANQLVLLHLFELLNARNYEAVDALLHDDVHWEMPYAPPALPAPFDRHRIGKVFRSFRTVFSQPLTFGPIDITPMLDPDRFLVEFHGEAVMAATGEPYRNDYVGLFSFRDGRIINAREYFNSAVAIRAFGWKPE